MAESITRAVVLAAGMGTRLRREGDACKPLYPVLGVPLLVRVLGQLQAAGVQDAVVILGYQGDEIKRRLRQEPSLGLTLHFVENGEFTKKNGVSVLAAEKFIDSECLLSMSDHLYSPELVRRLVSVPLRAGVSALGVDFDVERCFDLDDATKVRTSGGKIQQIGKELEDYNAIDTGVFRIGPELVRELKAIYAETGDCSLSEGVARLARRGEFCAVDIGDARWIDVDTPEALERAQAMIRVFGDTLGEEVGSGVGSVIAPESMVLFAPTWVRATEPYNEDHFALAEQGDVARLMSNESPFPPTPRVIQAIVQAATLGHRYPASARSLKEKLGEQNGLARENVLLGAGSSELIDVVIRTFVAPGEEVLLSVPTFSMYEARTRAVGGVPVLVPMTEDHEHDFNGMVRGVTERTKVLFLCSPNNPTGNRASQIDLRRLLRLGLPTVIDEAYVEFEGDSEVGLLSDFPNAIVLRTFSKAYGLAGMRLGYLLAHAEVVRLFERVKVPWNIPSVTLAAATAALEETAEFAARLTLLRAAKERFFERLRKIPGVSVVPSDGNFLLLDVSGTGLTAEGIVSGVFAEGVLIRTLAVHHATKHFVRVTIGTDEQNQRCVMALRRVVQRRPLAEPRGMLVSEFSDAE